MDTPQALNLKLFQKVTGTERQSREKRSVQDDPVYFWVGCSEHPMSPAAAIGYPASKFVFHDNLANLTSPTDANFLAALDYSVNVMQVKCIVICGHYQCNSIKLAINGGRLEMANAWLMPVVKMERKYKKLLGDKSERINAICELNVVEQVVSACRTSVVTSAWERGQDLSVCGLIYNHQDKLLVDMNICVDKTDKLDDGYLAAVSGFLRRWPEQN